MLILCDVTFRRGTLNTYTGWLKTPTKEISLNFFLFAKTVNSKEEESNIKR